MKSSHLPQTTAHVRITKHSWQHRQIDGEVSAQDYTWSFQWQFSQGNLHVIPSQGRALIKEPLERFLERQDYQLEPGGDYAFTLRFKL